MIEIPLAVSALNNSKLSGIAPVIPGSVHCNSTLSEPMYEATNTGTGGLTRLGAPGMWIAAKFVNLTIPAAVEFTEMVTE